MFEFLKKEEFEFAANIWKDQKILETLFSYITN